MCKIFSNYRYFRYFRYFNGKLRNGRPKYGYIRHQGIQINKNPRFVFRFSRILFLTVFRYFRWPYWIEDIDREGWFANPYKAVTRR